VGFLAKLSNKSIQEAQTSALNYMREKAVQVRMALRSDRPTEALYRLGYSLHPIQDLAFHQGIVAPNMPFDRAHNPW
jgi:hypothetical protein